MKFQQQENADIQFRAGSNTSSRGSKSRVRVNPPMVSYESTAKDVKEKHTEDKIYHRDTMNLNLLEQGLHTELLVADSIYFKNE